MTVRRHVDRYAVDARRQVRAVIEIEAAQEELVRFAVAAVLSDDQAWHHFHELTGPKHRTQRELLAADNTFARGGGCAL